MSSGAKTSENINNSSSDLPFHIASEEEIFSALGTSDQGLTTTQADKYRERYGTNDISQVLKQPVIIQFLVHFKNPMVTARRH